MVRVGIVGCGNIGKVHAEVLKNMKHMAYTALKDILDSLLQEDEEVHR